jgi:N-acetylglutamate synthase-like GNAT family acetyltransferase
MELRQATEIAQLLNSRNQLEIPYTGQKVLEHASDYVFDLDDQVVVACVEIKRVQWYQWEICHLSVAETHEGHGRGNPPCPPSGTSS